MGWLSKIGDPKLVLDEPSGCFSLVFGSSGFPCGVFFWFPYFAGFLIVSPRTGDGGSRAARRRRSVLSVRRGGASDAHGWRGQEVGDAYPVFVSSGICGLSTSDPTQDAGAPQNNTLPRKAAIWA